MKMEQQQQKKYWKLMMKSRRKMWTLEGFLKKEEKLLKGEKQRLKDLTNHTRKCIRDKIRTKRQEKIQRTLEDLKRNQEHTRHQICKKKDTHHQDKNGKGEVITSRKGIANVFGEFYSKLSDDDKFDETEMESDKNETENNMEDQGTDVTETKEFPEITTEELQAAIYRLKKCKSADSNGIRVEDITACGEESKEMVRQIFNEVIKQKRMHTRSMAKN